MKPKLKQITKDEAKKKGYKMLGQAMGVDLGHCIYEGALHCRDFMKRVEYYVVKAYVKSETGGHKFITNKSQMMVVEFYEDCNQ